jgi:hypothetical protein
MITRTGVTRLQDARLDLDLLRLAAIIHNHSRAMLRRIEVVLSKRPRLAIHSHSTRHRGNTIELHAHLFPPHRIRAFARRKYKHDFSANAKENGRSL